jgi:hypothetical protein
VGDKVEKNEMGRESSACGSRGEACTGLENLNERDHLGDRGIDGRIIFKWIFWKWNVEVWTGSSWLRIGTHGEHL